MIMHGSHVVSRGLFNASVQSEETINMEARLQEKESRGWLPGNVAWASRGATRREALGKLICMLSDEFKQPLAALIERIPEDDKEARKLLDEEGFSGVLLRDGYGKGFFAGAKARMLVKRLTRGSPLLFLTDDDFEQTFQPEDYEDKASGFDAERVFDEYWQGGKSAKRRG